MPGSKRKTRDRQTKRQMDERLREVVKTPSKISERFHNYRIVADNSWLQRGQTFEEANRMMQHSIASTGSISGVPCLWAEDLKSEYRVSETPAQRGGKSERTCNSFLQYRILVQRCFSGQQTDISKEVEGLWRNESKEMHFFCLRNSEIETRMSVE